MKNLDSNTLTELTVAELTTTSGGGFAYDFGFFLREVVIGLASGGSSNAAVAVGVDVGLHYRPIK